MQHNYNQSSWTDILFNLQKHTSLRGDEFLWKELEERLATESKPNSTQDFDTLLMVIINELGIDLESSDHMQKIDRYPDTGMSGGYIHLDTWRIKNIPLLKECFANQLA